MRAPTIRLPFLGRGAAASAVARSAMTARHLLFPGLIALLFVAILLNLGMGAVKMSPQQVIAIALDRIGIHLDVAYTAQERAVFWSIRLPRIVLATLVGAGLAASGAALQGIFRNPLADPGLVGVSSGAALGAVTTIVLGVRPLGTTTLPVAAFIGGLLTTMLVYTIARQHGRTEVVTLLLVGIALNSVAGAGVAFMTYLADDTQLRMTVFWSMGSASSATWPSVAAVTPFIVGGLLILPRWGQTLNLLVLGEREARHLGVATERVRLILITVTALMTGAAVAVSGIIGFVGLVVPHIIRLVAGPDHRRLIPASALGGAALLLFADLAARVVAVPAELPLGMVTAVAGGPVFLWLVLRTRRSQGGWA